MSAFARSVLEEQSRWQHCISGMRARDPQALAWLYDETSKVLYSLCLRMLCDPAEAQEVMLSVYRELWEKPDTIGNTDALQWLLLRTHAKALEQIRRGRSAVPIEGNAAGIAGNLAREEVSGAVQVLPQEEREALSLVFFSGWTAVEIAASIGAPLGTIKKRLCAGMSRLRKQIAGAGENIH